MNMNSADIPKESTLIAVASTFTADPIGPSLEFWIEQLGMSAQVRFAPYDQLFQQLLDPSSLLARNENGINVILIRLEDWRPEVERNARDFLQALAQLSRRSTSSFLVCLTPSSDAGAPGPDTSLRGELQALLLRELKNCPGVHAITPEELQSLYPVANYYDAQSDRLARIPYVPLFFSALGTMIGRKVCALNRPRYKVIVLDCDETLWQGTCGEDGPTGVHVGPEGESFQKFMIGQHDAGMLLSLCSKNNEEDVLAVFTSHPRMLLKRDHLVSWRINWRQKSENLKALSAELHLGLDSFIFIDDDPIECAEVRAHCPQVLTIELPEPGRRRAFLEHVWAFDQLSITSEGRNRTALYQQNALRENLQRESLTFQDFLSSLDLRVDVSPLQADDLTRASELTFRTNQFNFTGVRRSIPELQTTSLTPEITCLGVRIKDRFGDYGLAGLLILKRNDEALSVDTFLLSCRALGKGAEHQIVARLGEIAREQRLARIEFHFVPTARNLPAREFLRNLGKSNDPLSEKEFLFSITPEFAASVQYNPPEGWNGAQSTEQERLEEPQVDSGNGSNDGLFTFIARELNSIEKIHAAVIKRSQIPARMTSDFIPPETPMELKVAAILGDILGVEQIGVNDSFFELGGHSLLAVQVLARIREAFDVELSPSILYLGEFTVAGLSKAILSEQIQQASPTHLDAILQKLAALPDDEVRRLIHAAEDEKPD